MKSPLSLLAAALVLGSAVICRAQSVVPTETEILDALDEPERAYAQRRVEEETRAAQTREAADPLPFGNRSDLVRTPPGGFVRLDGSQQFEINQVIDKGSVLLGGKTAVWLEGIDSSGVTDDSVVALEGIFWIKGTKTYTAVSGAARTIKNAILVNDVVAERAVDRILELQTYRTWTSKSGNYTLEDARLKSFSKGEVTLLQKGRDKPIVVKLSELSEECQKAIRDQMKIAAERRKARNK